MCNKLLILVVVCFIPAAFATENSILIYGDSLSTSSGIAIQQGWVSLLQERLDVQGYNYQVVNASISGDTSRGASARLDNLLADLKPSVTIVELGGNDGLRGISPDEMYKNLSSIINRLLDRGSRIVLVPIQIPPNFGQIYITRFQEVYKKLALNHDLVLTRFILEGIALNSELMQNDGIHPKAEAQFMMLDNIWSDLKIILDKLQNGENI